MSRISSNNSAAASSYSASPTPSASTPSDSSTTTSATPQTYTTVRNAFALIKKRDKDRGISIADFVTPSTSGQSGLPRRQNSCRIECFTD